MRRSNHIAVNIPEDQVEAAVAHYIAVFGVEEKSRSDEGIELVGPNFTLWIVAAEDSKVLQEFVTKDGPGTRKLVEDHGCQIASETPYGFMVHDPYGLKYHVFVEAT